MMPELPLVALGCFLGLLCLIMLLAPDELFEWFFADKEEKYTDREA